MIFAAPSAAAPALYSGSGGGATTVTNSGCAPSDQVCVDTTARVTGAKAGFDENGCFYIYAQVKVGVEVKVLNKTTNVSRTITVNETVCDVPPLPSPDERPCDVTDYSESKHVGDAALYSMDYDFVMLSTLAPATWNGAATVSFQDLEGLHLATLHMECPFRLVSVQQ